MTEAAEQQEEKRLHYNWPVWFAHDFNGVLTQGQMFDIHSQGASFTCYADKCPAQGEDITTRFSVPRYGEDNSFELENFIRQGHIHHVEEIAPFVRRVCIGFTEALPFKPGEIDDTEALAMDDTIQDSAVDDVARAEAAAMADDLSAGDLVQTKGAAAAEVSEQAIAEEFENEVESTESAVVN